MVQSTPADPVAYAYLHLLEGHAWDDIKQAMRAAFPKAKPDRVLEEVRKRFAAVAAGDAAVLKGWCIASAQDLHRKMVGVGDYAGALKAIKLVHDVATKKQEGAQPKAATVNL